MWTSLARIQTSSLLEMTAAVCLLFRLPGRPLPGLDLARLLEAHRAAARSHILRLISLGLLARPGPAEGFTPTGKGRHFLPGKFSPGMVDFSPGARRARARIRLKRPDRHRMRSSYPPSCSLPPTCD